MKSTMINFELVYDTRTAGDEDFSNAKVIANCCTFMECNRRMHDGMRDALMERDWHYSSVNDSSIIVENPGDHRRWWIRPMSDGKPITPWNMNLLRKITDVEYPLVKAIYEHTTDEGVCHDLLGRAKRYMDSKGMDTPDSLLDLIDTDYPSFLQKMYGVISFS